MSSAIDRVGAFRGEILESGVGATKNGFPQFVVSLKAAERWVDDAAEMEAFGLSEPAWVDWSSYDQQLTGYLVLFGANRQTGDGYKATFHIENLVEALDWDGTTFAALGGADMKGTKVAFWVDEDDYDGNVSMQIQSIAHIDTSPVRALRKLDAAALGNLDAKFAAFMPKKKAPAPAPARVGGPPAAKYHAEEPTAAPAPASSPASPAPASSPASPVPATPQTPPFETQGMSRDEAWEHICTNRGAAADNAMAEAWIAASSSIAPGKDESTMTDVEWAKIAVEAVKTLQTA